MKRLRRILKHKAKILRCRKILNSTVAPPSYNHTTEPFNENFTTNEDYHNQHHHHHHFDTVRLPKSNLEGNDIDNKKEVPPSRKDNKKSKRFEPIRTHVSKPEPISAQDIFRKEPIETKRGFEYCPMTREELLVRDNLQVGGELSQWEICVQAHSTGCSNTGDLNSNTNTLTMCRECNLSLIHI